MSKSHPHRLTPHQQERITHFLTHLICIGILFVLPEVLVGFTSPHGEHTPWGMYAKSLLFVVAFYINYFFIIDYWGKKKIGIAGFIVYNLPIIAMVLLCSYSFIPEPHPMNAHEIHRAIGMELHEHPHHMSRIIGFMSRDLTMLVLTIGLSVALKLSNRWKNMERRQQMLAAESREQELKQLKSQLNPHFLFNSLNTIYALIAISPEKAQGAVHTLSRLLRYALYDNSGMVSIEQEIDFLNDYIRLMALRIGNRPGLKVNLDAGSHADARIPAMLCISIVENVFKHGNTGSDNDIFEISLNIDDNDTFRFHTVNHFNANREKEEASGIGVANMHRRLDLIYGENASLTCNANGDLYTVEMLIKLGTEKVPELQDPINNTSNTTAK